ncbi:hypothetical protein [Herbiconiux sp. UC225_62]
MHIDTDSGAHLLGDLHSAPECHGIPDADILSDPITERHAPARSPGFV